MLNSRDYKTLVVVGSQWGDEGKGKITDFYAQDADLVVRFAGGDNAGHVIWNEGKKYKVTIVPSGILNPKVMNVIGNGCVVNLNKLNDEMAILNKAGVDTKNLFVSDRAHVIFKYNEVIDELQEEQRQNRKIGTTKRGIGPTYADKASRCGIRICDFAEPNFKDLLEEQVEYHNKLITDIYGGQPLDFNTIYEDALKQYANIKDRIVDSGSYVNQAIRDNKFVLFEGAQGVLLDIDHGTYPFVTSSNTTANNVSIGTGIHNKLINKVVGVAKAYDTRVGTGGFPTELLDATGDRIRERGHEYGSNTGRPRRIGWFDAVAMNYSIRTGGLDALFITLLDVLDTEETVKICTGYKYNGKVIDTIPASNTEYEKCEPVYEELPGWQEDITKVTSFDQLPKNAQNYINRIAELCDVAIQGFSVGPDRHQTVTMLDKFEG
ncbi:adenylosuccinate synthase [Mesoplasma lactucae]|uniref:Adenylosuccinate synthetase n=1 Tax=Mesoplasma lactucae ATCC 49193 TaxID=81460 RepID=A0A291ISL3_9MOLU|nr:adenylosuccinate synthase [Mesoplasma lactucae]ATG97734.1 adenylosuccinate synthase [Mesoplasma lactucae ATCC 49193]ATZ20489.1 adenylosuccinate synthetase [Mesoplasma lactucae ATCC 49193]MCL8216660.1 Adenylosuccinate synthetase [Mesoplasma lactucae ATCC 49193]